MRSLLLAAPLLLAALLTGCSSQSHSSIPAAELDALRGKFLAAAEPEGAAGVLATHELLQGASAEAKSEDEHDHGEDAHDDHDHDAEDKHEHEGHDHEGHDHEAHAHDDHDHDHAHESEPQEVVVVGLIGGVANPWEQGKAAFMISEVDAKHDHDHDHAHDDHNHAHDDHDHDHDGHAHDDHDHAAHGHSHDGDHHDCPFCARGKSGVKTLAIVRFVDEKGEILPIDSRELFQLKEQQQVVVKGPAHLDGLGNLIITGEALFVRP